MRPGLAVRRRRSVPSADSGRSEARIVQAPANSGRCIGPRRRPPPRHGACTASAPSHGHYRPRTHAPTIPGELGTHPAYPSGLVGAPGSNSGLPSTPCSMRKLS